jgi:predicted site-specific integrase-resolvase
MKLGQYAKQQGIRYRTALRWFRAGMITGYQAPTGTIIVTEGAVVSPVRPEQVAIYARVSSPAHREHLERQAARLVDDCAPRGYRGSGGPGGHRHRLWRHGPLAQAARAARPHAASSIC